ncbi:alginate lyase family protein [Siphonobacter curvatus]|uniref:Alginate lyase n=1 Tax=Siphonobacter curvatus TaxID=2094562 RepID=A0A2S7IFY7_9BACT|nr:alginate lyase family protein [Siphonobacter curvatus]PQA54414.1 alginate lyase [Siphonobacter curvatus]
MKMLLISLTFVATHAFGQADLNAEIRKTLQASVQAEVRWALQQPPRTVTAQTSPRSAGGRHDFYSEGDYWWPDSTNLQGPYLQRDGLSNPDNFVAHRQALIRLSQIMGALASAYVLQPDRRYSEQALRHLKAWFVDTTTRMNPSLTYAQAIKGRVTGRGIGIIDTIHLMEVVQAVQVMEAQLDAATVAVVRRWFRTYLHWLTHHPYGIEEREAKNNHGTCWVMQVAAFARFTGHDSLLAVCRDWYKTVLLPQQMAADGSFPLELRRTKPYGYSLFNLDAMAMICQIASTPRDNLWTYETPDGRSIRRGISYLYPYVVDKNRWPLPPDVMYWDDWPVAQPFLVFGALAFQQPEWLQTWKKGDHTPANEEVIRNLPIRHPLLWLPHSFRTN